MAPIVHQHQPLVHPAGKLAINNIGYYIRVCLQFYYLGQNSEWLTTLSTLLTIHFTTQNEWLTGPKAVPQ